MKSIFWANLVDSSFIESLINTLSKKKKIVYKKGYARGKCQYIFQNYLKVWEVFEYTNVRRIRFSAFIIA